MTKHFAKTNIPRYLKEKRGRKLTRRSHREWRALERGRANVAMLYERFGHRSKIVEMIANGLPDPERTRKGRIGFRMPAEFSIIDGPERALAALSDLAKQMRARRLGSIFLDQRALAKYDLCANGLLDVLVDELSTEARRTGRKIRWRGAYPSDPVIRRYVQAMGVIRRLQIEHEYPEPDEAARLEVFDARAKHYVRPLRPREADKKTRVTAQFADHVNRCLGRVGRKLTPEALSRMCKYVSEILDNAEEHAGMLDWTIQGYLDTHSEQLMCEIAIFNFGKSIAQTLDDLPETSYTKQQQVRRYLDLHTKRGLFRPGWRKEDLLTLIALQGNVSSKNFSEDDTRGNGTVDLIEFFQNVHRECSDGAVPSGVRMAIVSGSTFILFDGKYKMVENAAGGRIIAFNHANSLAEKPDPEYVRPLEGVSFPGTAVGIQFLLKANGSTVMNSLGDQNDNGSDDH